jgi:hypothetical protein
VEGQEHSILLTIVVTYAIGSVIAVLYEATLCIYRIFVYYFTHYRENLMKVGLMLDWSTLRPSRFPNTPLTGASFCLVAAALSWIDVLWSTLALITQLSIKIGEPRDVSEARWRLKHQDLGPEAVLRNLSLWLPQFPVSDDVEKRGY